MARIHPVLFRSFFWAPLHPIAERNRISDESYLGRDGKNTIWMQRETASPNSIYEMPVHRPRSALRNHSALTPFCILTLFPFIARHSSGVARHMHTKYIKRPAPVPKYGVVYIWGSYKGEKEERRDWIACGSWIFFLFIPLTRRWRRSFILIAKRSNREHITVIVKMENKSWAKLCDRSFDTFEGTMGILKQRNIPLTSGLVT